MRGSKGFLPTPPSWPELEKYKTILNQPFLSGTHKKLTIYLNLNTFHTQVHTYHVLLLLYCKSVRETTTQHKVRARALTNNSQKKMIYDIIFPTLKCGK